VDSLDTLKIDSTDFIYIVIVGYNGIDMEF
jgi:hypothetical protein